MRNDVVSRTLSSAAAAVKRKHEEAHQQSSYRQHQAAQLAVRKLSQQLRAAKEACRTLDEQAGVLTNVLTMTQEEQEACAAQQQQQEEQQQQQGQTTFRAVAGSNAAAKPHEQELEEYLDEQHRLRRQQQQAQAAGLDNDDTLQELGALDDKPAAVISQDLLHALKQVLLYVRHEYCYCLYCGCRYADAAEMAANCPGLVEEDHDD